jgi:hypothetical protein
LTVFLTGGARRNGIFAALALSAALITKFTGLMLVPFAILLVIGVAAMRVGRYRGLPLRKSLSAAVVLLVLFGVCGAFSINAIYRFEQTGLSVTKILEQSEPMLGGSRKSGGRLLEKKTLLASLPGWLPVPLPYTYLYGLAFVGEHNEGGHSSWFLGESSRRGNPLYFPVMILIKTPIALLAALACALVVALRKRARVELPTFILLAYAGCYLLIAMRASLNIGIRHVLPILPILAIIGGLALLTRGTHSGRGAIVKRWSRWQRVEV